MVKDSASPILYIFGKYFLNSIANVSGKYLAIIYLCHGLVSSSSKSLFLSSNFNSLFYQDSFREILFLSVSDQIMSFESQLIGQ